MKKIICLFAGLLALNLITPVFGQQPAPPVTPVFPPSMPRQYAPPSVPPSQQLVELEAQRIRGLAGSPANEPPTLTKFNLDFPGGTPAELVAAIEKATGKPLNAIISTEDADLQMPPLKMNDVFVPQLFAALEVASRKTVAVSTGQFGNSYSVQNTSYGFDTADGPVTDTSIWYFHAEKPSLPPMVSTEKICRFFSLAPYLDRGFTVDDITTAIQTGWKMAGANPPPEMDYHKETRLLIAFGEPTEVNLIDNVLSSLPYSSIGQNQFNEMQGHIEQLQKQVDQLKKQINPPPPTTVEVK